MKKIDRKNYLVPGNFNRVGGGD